MRTTKGIIREISVLFVILAVGVAMMSIMTGCQTTTTVTKSAEEIQAEELALQQAIADSLYQVNKIEFMKSASSGHEYYKQKQYEDALPHFQLALELISDQTFATKIDKEFSGAGSRLYRELALTYSNNEQQDSAKVVFENAVEKFPDNAYFQRSAGYYRAAVGENDLAVDNYLAAIELDGDDAKLDDYKQAGNLLSREDRLEEALELYQKAAAKFPEDAEIQNLIPSIMSQLGYDRIDLIDAKKTALAANPNENNLVFQIAKMYFQEQMYDSSAVYYAKYVEKNPEDIEALEYYGGALQQNEDYRDALGVYEKVLTLKPDHAKVMCEMSTCYREIDQFKNAYNKANQAIRTDSKFALGYIVKAEVYVAVADDCIASREDKAIKFDDKLVFNVAYNLYQKAYGDIDYGSYAKSLASSLQSSESIPTKSDYFMFPNKKKPDLPCYSWLAF